MRTLILYTTKTGATKQYALWMNEEIENSTLATIDKFNSDEFNKYERVVFALPTYRGKIDKTSFLENSWTEIKDKDIYLVVIGMVPQESPWSKKSYEAIDKSVRNGLKGYVKLPGITPENERGKEKSWFEKLMMKVFLRTDPDNMKQQSKVYRKDLEPTLKMLR